MAERGDGIWLVAIIFELEGIRLINLPNVMIGEEKETFSRALKKKSKCVP